MKTKIRTWIYPIIIFGIAIFIIISCKKSDDEDNTTNTVTDIDGNVYHTVTIGTQVWMVENLKTTKYRNGTALSNITDNDDWESLSTGAYCDYDNIPSNSITYGRLYNWYAIKDELNICPSGWHVPTDAEWTTLTTYLGGESVAGKLKETGTTHWQSPNTGATNESGFTALPSGYRYSGADFQGIGTDCDWWSSTEYSSNYAWCRGLDYNNVDLDRYSSHKEWGFSVRCVKD